ncbi:TolC family protein [uncultured Desulfosarcina sp.]|uniref:TolC family protein n=1 Tax=uncultured Desulfosarcina sp. TaxID=218289 RepID=UPI0029C83D07|nr:TolC family protein [uncultured Desulfosarcina sp.]
MPGKAEPSHMVSNRPCRFGWGRLRAFIGWTAAALVAAAWLTFVCIAADPSTLEAKQPDAPAVLSVPDADAVQALEALPPQPLHFPAEPSPRPAAPLPVGTLAMLEAEMIAAPEVLIAAADLDEKMSRLDHAQARSGLELQGRAGIGGYRELTGDDATRDYGEMIVGGLVRYPLFGSYERQKIDIAKAEARTWESRHNLAMARLNSLRALRAQYIDYWGSTRKIELSRTFLTKRKEVERVINHRTATGRMLEADRREFMTAFAMAQRSLARMQAVQARSLRIIRRLTRPDLAPFSPEPPNLAKTCDDLSSLKASVLDEHPDIQLYRSLVDEQLGVVEMTRIGNWKAFVDLGGYASREDTASDNEYGLALNLTVTLPAEIRRANQAERKASLAALRKAQLELDLRSDQLLEDMETAFWRVQSEKRGLAFAHQRLEAALELLREKLLRSNRLPGDTLEQLEQARYTYYRNALDAVDAHMEAYRWQSELLHHTAAAYDPDSSAAAEDGPVYDSIINDNYLNPLWLQAMPEKTEEAEEASARIAGPSGYGAYLWKSRLLPPGRRAGDSFWRQLASAGIDRLLVSFDGPQLEALRHKKPRIDLNHFLTAAHEHKVKIELLLGEPLWILPAHRRDLLAIIQQLADLPFDGLHLDLEPNQLDTDRYGETFLLAQLLRTVQAAKLLSPWPVGLSIHPRYLDDERTEICLGCALTNMELDELTLMIYVARPKRVSQIAGAIQKRFPRLRISVAQSVEPELSADESYAGNSRSFFVRQMDALSVELAGPTFAGILIQSYSDFMDMRP